MSFNYTIACHVPQDGGYTGSVTKRLLCLPVPSTDACKRQGKVALWPRVAIKRCGQSKAWHAVAGMWTRFHVKMRSHAPSEPWLDSNLFVTLPCTLHLQPWSYHITSTWCHSVHPDVRRRSFRQRTGEMHKTGLCGGGGNHGTRTHHSVHRGTIYNRAPRSLACQEQWL